MKFFDCLMQPIEVGDIVCHGGSGEQFFSVVDVPRPEDPGKRSYKPDWAAKLWLFQTRYLSDPCEKPSKQFKLKQWDVCREHKDGRLICCGNPAAAIDGQQGIDYYGNPTKGDSAWALSISDKFMMRNLIKIDSSMLKNVLWGQKVINLSREIKDLAKQTKEMK